MWAKHFGFVHFSSRHSAANPTQSTAPRRKFLPILKKMLTWKEGERKAHVVRWCVGDVSCWCVVCRVCRSCLLWCLIRIFYTNSGEFFKGRLENFLAIHSAQNSRIPGFQNSDFRIPEFQNPGTSKDSTKKFIEKNSSHP